MDIESVRERRWPTSRVGMLKASGPEAVPGQSNRTKNADETSFWTPTERPDNPATETPDPKNTERAFAFLGPALSFMHYHPQPDPGTRVSVATGTACYSYTAALLIPATRVQGYSDRFPPSSTR